MDRRVRDGYDQTTLYTCAHPQRINKHILKPFPWGLSKSLHCWLPDNPFHFVQFTFTPVFKLCSLYTLMLYFDILFWGYQNSSCVLGYDREKKIKNRDMVSRPFPRLSKSALLIKTSLYSSDIQRPTSLWQGITLQSPSRLETWLSRMLAQEMHQWTAKMYDKSKIQNTYKAVI